MNSYGNKHLIDSSQHIVDYVNQCVRQKFAECLEKYNSQDNTINQLVHAELENVLTNLSLDTEDVLTETLREYTLSQSEIQDAYKHFESENLQRLTNQFEKTNNNKTSTRGIKIRGNFETIEEAQQKAKQLNQDIEPSQHIYVAEVGKWLPWNPNPDLLHSEYMVEELNNLMGEYNKNVAEKNIQFEERKTELMNNTDNRADLKEKLRKRIQEVRRK